MSLRKLKTPIEECFSSMEPGCIIRKHLSIHGNKAMPPHVSQAKTIKCTISDEID